MNRSSAPGLGQWLTVTVIVVLVSFLLVKLLQYGNFRQNYPAGLTIAGVNIGGYTPEQAEQLLNDRYISAPIIVYHGENRVEINPLQVEFELDFEAMAAAADYEKAQQDYWAGFWGFLIGQPVEIGDVDLVATHNQEALLDVLQRIANNFDIPAQPAQPVPGQFSFQYGDVGVTTDVEASLADVTSALYRPTDREAFLSIQATAAERPEMNLLARLLVNNTQEFEQTSGGVAAVFILDLENGDEIAINAEEPMSGMGMLRILLALEAYRLLDNNPTSAQAALIEDALLSQTNEEANALLAFISNGDDPNDGALIVTDSIRRLGLENTFILTAFGEELNAGSSSNSDEPTSFRAEPTPGIQTTAEEMGTLLSMLYFCATQNSGGIVLAFEGAVTQAECQQLVTTLNKNEIGSLIEQGVPMEVDVAHRHGWIDNTHGDAGIVFSPSGAYVIVEILYKPVWLEWEISSPLMANISRATYNYFNFDEPYLDDTRSN